MLLERLSIVVAATILLTACQMTSPDDKDGPSLAPPTGISPEDQPPYLSTMTPYPVPSSTKTEVPDGFKTAFVTAVARHGARSLTSEDSLEDALELWEGAEQAGALTSLGRRFGPDLRAMMNAMDRVGYGDLNTLGREEMEAIGVREGERVSSLFEGAPAEGAKIDIIDSGRGRAQESAEYFSRGLGREHPQLEIEPPETNEELLKFDNENNEYEDFLDDGPWKDPYNEVRRLSGIDAAAPKILEKLYAPEYVATIDEPLSAANGVFDLYRSGPSMSRDVNIDTAQYMDEKMAQVFAYVDDGRYFYSRGPGAEGEDGSYQAAQVLLDDFFDVIDDRLEGRGPHPHAGVYRFAHAEEMTPFAALLSIPNADEAATPDATFKHENNDFRVERIAQLSSNISWTVWTNEGEEPLVSVAHNEVAVPVGRGCEKYQGTENFYELDELRSCLGDLLGGA